MFSRPICSWFNEIFCWVDDNDSRDREQLLRVSYATETLRSRDHSTVDWNGHSEGMSIPGDEESGCIEVSLTRERVSGYKPETLLPKGRDIIRALWG